MGLCIIEGNGNPTVDPSIMNVRDLGSDTSFDVSSIHGYERFTVGNFKIVDISLSLSSEAWYGGTGAASVTAPTATNTLNMSYNQSTGILTVNNVTTSTSGSSGEGGNTCNASVTLLPHVQLIYNVPEDEVEPEDEGSEDEEPEEQEPEEPEEEPIEE